MSQFVVRHKWLILVAVALAALLALSACGDGDGEEPTATSTPGQQIPDEATRTLVVNLASEPRTLDPALATDEVSINVIQNIFVALTRVDEATAEIVPYLATDWDTSDDGRTYTFHLRDDVRWTDGTTVTAQDVEFGILRTLNPETASEYAYVIHLIEGAEEFNTEEGVDPGIVAVQAIDDVTLEVTLAEAASYFPAIASMWIMMPQPRAAIEEHGDAWIEPGNIVTNGPYLLDSWDHGVSITLKKNRAFFNADNVQIPEVEMLMIEEESTTLVLYEAGDLDSFFVNEVPGTDIPRIMADPVLSQEYTVYPELDTYYYGFNVEKPPFDNVLVRRAFAGAVDKEAIVTQITKGGEQPTTIFTAPGNFGSPGVESGIGIPFNPEQAAADLAEAGFPNGDGLPPIVLQYNTSERHERIAQAIQAMWQEHLGVEVTLASQDFPVHIDTLVSDAPQVFRIGWGADYPDANNWLHDVFHSGSGNNFTNFSNAEFDDLVTTAATEPDPDVRLQLYRDAETILVEDVVAIIPIFHGTDPQLTKPYVLRTKAPFGGEQIYNWKIVEG